MNIERQHESVYIQKYINLDNVYTHQSYATTIAKDSGWYYTSRYFIPDEKCFPFVFSFLLPVPVSVSW